MGRTTVVCLFFLGVMLSSMANEFAIFDCKQMFHSRHPCNKQELLAYRFQTEACNRINSQSELHAYRTCLGHSGIRIQEICNVCSFFTYPMICGREKSKRVLRCLGDQFIIQGHGEEAVVAAKLCGNLVRSHHTSTTLATSLLRPIDSANHWTTPPTTKEEANLPPYQPRQMRGRQDPASSGGFPKTQYFRSKSKNMLQEDHQAKKVMHFNQHRLRPGQRQQKRHEEEPVRAEDDDMVGDTDDNSMEADAQEKSLRRGSQLPSDAIRRDPVMASPPLQQQRELLQRNRRVDPLLLAAPIPPPARQFASRKQHQMALLGPNSV